MRSWTATVRLLCFVNRDQPKADVPEPRPRSYNERMLQAGRASPYFICPNVNPFRPVESRTDAVPAPGALNAVANGQSGLGPARGWVRTARSQGLGLFDPADPLHLQPFELRFLASRRAPSRWVIDLSDPATNVLIRPENYHWITN